MPNLSIHFTISELEINPETQQKTIEKLDITMSPQSLIDAMMGNPSTSALSEQETEPEKIEAELLDKFHELLKEIGLKIVGSLTLSEEDKEIFARITADTDILSTLMLLNTLLVNNKVRVNSINYRSTCDLGFENCEGFPTIMKDSTEFLRVFRLLFNDIEPTIIKRHLLGPAKIVRDAENCFIGDIPTEFGVRNTVLRTRKREKLPKPSEPYPGTNEPAASKPTEQHLRSSVKCCCSSLFSRPRRYAQIGVVGPEVEPEAKNSGGEKKNPAAPGSKSVATPSIGSSIYDTRALKQSRRKELSNHEQKKHRNFSPI